MSEQPIPEQYRHLIGEISLKDIQRLIALEQGSPKPADVISPTPPAGEDPVLRDTAALTAHQDYVPWTENIELDRLRPVDGKQKEGEEDPGGGLPLPTVDDIVVASTVGVLGVGVVLENSYHQLRALQRAFNRQSHLARGVELILVGTLILTLIGFFVVHEVKAYIRSQQGPFLADALVAPYSLDSQIVPAGNINAASLIPSTFGGFQHTKLPITRDYSSSPTNQCLLGLGYNKDVIQPPLCSLAYSPISLSSGRYAYGWQSVDVVIARFTNDDAAERTMFDLLHHVRKYGRVGNFSVGNGSVDFFYSSVYGWYSFTWSHGPWIFSISGPKMDYVENAVKNFNILPVVPPSSSGA